jgi:hypothetical protein
MNRFEEYRLAGQRGQLADSTTGAYDQRVSAMRLTGDRPPGKALAGLCAVAWTALGCTNEVPHTSDEATGSTHAIITVERSSAANREASDRAAAVATFVRVPVTVDSAVALDVIGLELALPEMSQCAARDSQRDPSVPLSPIDQVELLDAGDVSIVAAELDTTLAPRAFPTVTDLVSGVVYTTRDLAAEPLPAGVAYEVQAAGSAALEPLEVTGKAPPELSSVTLGGRPLSEVRTVQPTQPIDLTWAVGAPGDVVYVELTAQDAPATVCAFRDDDGAASVPAGAFAGRGAGRISLHRVRSHVFETPALASGELRFDFELAADVTFGE